MGQTFAETVLANKAGLESTSPGEIVEITLVAGLFSYFNRFIDALRVEITK